jgi:hypothetical protein
MTKVKRLFIHVNVEVELSITNHLNSFYVKFGEVQGGANVSM